MGQRTNVLRAKYLVSDNRTATGGLDTLTRGVVSKNDMGARSTALRSWACSTMDPRTAPRNKHSDNETTPITATRIEVIHQLHQLSKAKHNLSGVTLFII